MVYVIYIHFMSLTNIFNFIQTESGDDQDVINFFEDPSQLTERFVPKISHLRHICPHHYRPDSSTLCIRHQFCWQICPHWGLDIAIDGHHPHYYNKVKLQKLKPINRWICMAASIGKSRMLNQCKETCRTVTGQTEAWWHIRVIQLEKAIFC